MKAVVGLGNIGIEYKETRHNVGFWAVSRLASNHNISINLKKYNSFIGRGEICGNDLLLVKPETYMNRSGKSVRAILDAFNLTSKDLIIIHDDIDTPLGKVKSKIKGGDGGHRGIRSIIESIQDNNFSRIKIGVGRPPSNLDVVEYVLSPFKKKEVEIVNSSIDISLEKVEEILINKGGKN